MDPDSIRFYRMYNSKPVKLTLRMFVLANLCLAFFEEPAVYLISPVYTISFELIWLTVFYVQAWAKYRFLRTGRLRSDKKNVAHIVIGWLQILDIIIYVAMAKFGYKGVRWSRSLRVW